MVKQIKQIILDILEFELELVRLQIYRDMQLIECRVFNGENKENFLSNLKDAYYDK